MYRCSFLATAFFIISSYSSVNSQGILSDLPPPCEFYGTLSASTNAPWATDCSMVVGDIVIDATSNMTETQLQKLFQNVDSIEGSLVVRNTALKQLSFLKNLKVLTRGWSENILEIVENPLLTQIYLEKLNHSNGVIVVKDNPQLDLAKYCKMFDKLLLGNRVILRNKVNCGFQIDFGLTFTSILNVPANLSVIYGNVFFEDTGINPERLAVFRSVKKLYGCLRVVQTNFETLSFLENLEEIHCQSQAAIKITGNNYLEYLGFQKLTKITTLHQLEISNNRILEISFDEAELFASLSVPSDRIAGLWPKEDLPADICTFNSLKDDIASLPENCTSLLGLLYYNGVSFSEKQVAKFQQIRKIYGNIDMVAVNIQDLSMFSSLETIISFNVSYPAIQLLSIPNIKSVKLPKLQKLYAPTSSKFIIDEFENLNITLADCSFFKDIIHEPLTIDWMACDLWYELSTSTSPPVPTN
ncbi:hypothetical protein Y032_0048g1632 [Ancylostoma ceylanicum]|uniref:Receptor L-domain domain-containing protein n=1 Tax=Ancylostoma ceylanicum TaxID=53326 RepID=A0A016UAF7_9BILA|nr:hypothetical protein Y032_0048g1632 [Ancylostoma ceylanicum]